MSITASAGSLTSLLHCELKFLTTATYPANLLRRAADDKAVGDNVTRNRRSGSNECMVTDVVTTNDRCVGANGRPSADARACKFVAP